MTAEDNQITVRRFRAGDGERVREVSESAMAETPEYVPDIPDEDLWAIDRHYLDGEGEFVVGVVDGTIVATGAYTTPDEWKEAYCDIDSETTELTRMRVAPEWQAQGFGSAIYRELERRARSDGYRRFVLDTGTGNEVARGFYERLGFTCRQAVTIDFGDGTFGLVLYEKSIDG